ncbi:MAG: three-Cys-motif partner protein TcmP [Chloroflexi bacterium]|nr:three-Cys-motif partner protein TcmP [Chloroflexota bacterium]
MTRVARLRFDKIGYWSEIKLDIIRKYAVAYSQILSAQRDPAFHHVYVDAFAGAGQHISKKTGRPVAGSPLNALSVHPPFREYHFIELVAEKADALRAAVGQQPTVHVHTGDCNHLLLEQIFPQLRYEDYRRALVLLDPYGLHLDWEVIHTAGSMRSIEIFLNFPVADMNRNVLWRYRPDEVDERDSYRMNRYWGDESWREIVYEIQGRLFGCPVEVKTSNANAIIAEAFRKRLEGVAGFKHVPKPIPMRNAQGATIYYYSLDHTTQLLKILLNRYLINIVTGA